MQRKKYQLQFCHVLLIALLMILGVCLIANRKPYQVTVAQEQLKDVCFSFLQEGEYGLEITYEGNPGGNAIIVSSDSLTDSENHVGVELARLEIEEGAGVVHIPFRLEQGTHNVRVFTELDDGEHRYFSRVILQSVSIPNRDGYLLGALCFAAALLVGLIGRFLPFEQYRNALILLCMGLAASIPVLTDNLCSGDDLRYHLTRLEGLYQGMRAGDFPVRINPLQSEGFGNLSATMYPQMFLYPAALLRFAGMSLMLCYKVLIVAINVATAFLAFYSVKAITRSEKMGFAMSALYTFALYRLTNLYFRAALGESLAMVFLPLVVWGVYEIFCGDRKKWYLLALGITGVLQSHVLSLELCMFFLVLEGLYWLIFARGREFWKRLLAVGKAAALTALVNASFLIPFLYFSGEDLQVFHMESEVPGSGVYLSQVFQAFPPVLGKNLPQGTAEGEMPLSVGLVLLLGTLLFCAACFRQNGRSQAEKLGKHCLCYGLLSLLLASWMFPWEKLQEAAVIETLAASLQFAWRFLGPATLFLCIVSAVGIVSFVSERTERTWVYGVAAALLLCSTAYYFDSMASQVPQTSDKMALEGLTASDGMYMYREGDVFQALQLNYHLEDSRITTRSGREVKCAEYEKTGSRIHASVTPPDSAEDELLFPLYYYPGYEVRVDGEPVEVTRVDTLVACRMPDQIAEIDVRYRGPWFFRLGDILSLITVSGVAVYGVIAHRKRLLGIFHVAKRPRKS